MKRETIKKLLEWHGFDLDDVDLIWYKSDRVGDLYGALLTLADYIPSMIDADCFVVNKTIVNIHGDCVLQRIETQIKRLYDTQSRWEEHLRESRLNRVRKYFKERKDAQTMLSQPTYDYKLLFKQLTKHIQQQRFSNDTRNTTDHLLHNVHSSTNLSRS